MLQSINIHSSVPVYEQIENHVQFAIASGELNAGDRLPSVKELADRLGINFNTVAKAYRDLEVMGLIYTRRGMGCFIKEGQENQVKERCRNRIIRHFHEVVQEAKAAGFAKKDLTEAINVSLASKSSPYGEIPPEIQALIKRKR